MFVSVPFCSGLAFMRLQYMLVTQHIHINGLAVCLEVYALFNTIFFLFNASSNQHILVTYHHRAFSIKLPSGRQKLFHFVK